MDIQQNNVAVLHFNLVNQDGSTIFIRKTKLATFNLINPSAVSVPITDIGFDATLNQCWIRVPKESNATTGQYYGVLNIVDDDWGTYTTSKIKVYSVVSDADEDTKSIVFTATCLLKVNSADGQFHIPGVPNTTGVILAPHKDNDPMNGVSTLDLILIEKHIKGEQLLNSPFKMVAADVNRSGDIDIIDLVELRKLILGLYDKLPSSESWRFIPKNYTFKDLQHPFDYPMSMNIINEPDDLAADFTGLKVGDVNSTALAHRWMGTEIRSEGPGLILQAKNSLVKKGDFIDLVITSPNFRGISGLQGTLHTPGLQFISLAGGDLDMSESNIGHLNEDLLTISWHHLRSVDLPGDGALFTLRFKAKQDLNLSEKIWIGSDHTRAESYQGIGEIQNLSLEFTDASGSLLTKASNLLQNYPNPFNSQTTIGLRLESETKGVLSLFDINGRVIKRIEKTWTKGYQEIMIKDQEVHAPGIYFYQFESNIFTERRKMIFKP